VPVQHIGYTAFSILGLTIAGGWFLREFVEGFPWAHLDIAGTAYTDSEGPHQVKGPTAIGVRLFTEFLLRRAGA